MKSHKPKTVRDSNNKIIGYIEIEPGGRQILRDKNHINRGYYDPHKNVTRDKNHITIGEGNLLDSLLESPGPQHDEDPLAKPK